MGAILEDVTEVNDVTGIGGVNVIILPAATHAQLKVDVARASCPQMNVAVTSMPAQGTLFMQLQSSETDPIFVDIYSRNKRSYPFDVRSQKI